MSSDDHHIDYNTHILIGVRASGTMSVICRWHYVPRQGEVQEQIDSTRETYATFVLCTPTSIMPQGEGGRGPRLGASRSFGSS